MAAWLQGKNLRPQICTLQLLADIILRELVVSLSLIEFRKFKFSAIQKHVWKYIHNGHPAPYWMPEPVTLIWFLNVLFSLMVKADVQHMFNRSWNFQTKQLTKKAECQRIDVFKLSGWRRESPLDSKEIKPVNTKGNQSWTVTERNNVQTAAPVFWSPYVNSRLIGKIPDAGKD